MIGVFAAFGAALSWTYACSIWRIQTIHNKPININFSKNLLAFLIFSPSLLFIDYTKDFYFLFILIISGVIGIGLGDTFYLKSLQLIGTRKTLSIEALSPIIAASFGNFIINENLPIRAWIGIFIVTLSLIIIIKKHNYLINKDNNLIISKFNFWDYIYSFLSVFCAVIAALLSRIIFLESNLNPIETTEIRLFGAIIFLLFITRLKVNFFKKIFNEKNNVRFIISVLLGTNVGIFLQQVVFMKLPLGIGWTLLSISPIISLFFTKKEEGHLSKEKIILTFILFIGLIFVII